MSEQPNPIPDALTRRGFIAKWIYFHRWSAILKIHFNLFLEVWRDEEDIVSINIRGEEEYEMACCICDCPSLETALPIADALLVVLRQAAEYPYETYSGQRDKAMAALEPHIENDLWEANGG